MYACIMSVCMYVGGSSMYLAETKARAEAWTRAAGKAKVKAGAKDGARTKCMAWVGLTARSIGQPCPDPIRPGLA